MFKNSGKKCMTYAQSLFWVTSVLDTIAVIVLMCIDIEVFWFFILILPFAWIMNWIVSLMIYTLGASCEYARIAAKYNDGDLYEELYEQDEEQDEYEESYEQDEEQGVNAQSFLENNLLANGGWKCTSCGKVYPKHVTSCPCWEKENQSANSQTTL